MKKFVADDGVGDEHDQLVALNGYRVRVRGVGGTHQLRPFFPNTVLNRIVTDPVFDQQFIDQSAEIDGFAAFRATGIAGNCTKSSDQIFHCAAEFMGFV